MLHGHGDDGYRQPGRVKVNFSSNVLPGGCPPGLVTHLQAHLATPDRYPEVAAETLTARLAQREGVAPDNVLVTNGATAAIHLVAQAFRSRPATVVTPTFAEYADASVANGAALTELDWTAFAGGAPVAAGLLWLCNPNNPTGAALSPAWLRARVEAQPETLFVVDLAYADLSAEPALAAADTLTGPNLLLVKSLTKRFAIPGLRLGYLIGPAALLDAVRRFAPPWSVNTLALAAGEFLLATNPPPAWSLADYLAESGVFRRALARVDGVTVQPSTTGYCLCRLARGTGAELKAWLLREHGFLVRDAGNFRGLDAAHVRLATQRPEENRALVEAIQTWMHLS